MQEGNSPGCERGVRHRVGRLEMLVAFQSAPECDPGGTLVKVCHRPNGERAEKLTAVAGIPATQLSTVAAWPLGTVHPPGRGVVGLSMPRVPGRPAHELYSPAERKRRFPS